MTDRIAHYDRELLREQFNTSTPFRFFKIDNFLKPAFLADLLASYPSYEEAGKMGGKQFMAAKEKFKIQVTDAKLFPEPVKQLAETLNGPRFLSDLQYITGIDELLPDSGFAGGGIHLTNTSGRLDVHVDFNFNEHLNAFRRLNILVYLNPDWDKAWGGDIELWDADVTHCHHAFSPIANRCVVFETSETSYHGVTPLRCPKGITRQSFAAYYYTKDPPHGWDGKTHTTVFKTRPTETFRHIVVLPSERVGNYISNSFARLKRGFRKLCP